MRRWSPAMLLLTIAACVAACAVAALLCLMIGSTGISWPGQDVNIRMQSVGVAALVGAALAAAGVAYQAILRNPLADPYLLGVSSGASLLSLLWYVGALSTAAISVQAVGQQAFAFVGAILSIA